jgi:hypothetical protein
LFRLVFQIFKKSISSKKKFHTFINLYIYFFYSLLNDTNTYEKISYDPLEEMNNNINATLTDLKLNGDVSNKLFDRLFVKNNHLGSFRI